jgi:hypothetical protein
MPVGCQRSHRVTGQFLLRRPAGDDEDAGLTCSHKHRRSHADSRAQFFCVLSHRLRLVKTSDILQRPPSYVAESVLS